MQQTWQQVQQPQQQTLKKTNTAAGAANISTAVTYDINVSWSLPQPFKKFEINLLPPRAAAIGLRSAALTLPVNSLTFAEFALATIASHTFSLDLTWSFMLSHDASLTGGVDGMSTLQSTAEAAVQHMAATRAMRVLRPVNIFVVLFQGVVGFCVIFVLFELLFYVIFQSHSARHSEYSATIFLKIGKLVVEIALA